MKHSFIDKYSNLESPVHRVDPRAKLIAAFASIVIIVSETPGEVFPFVVYGIIVAFPLFLSRVPLGYIAKRCLVISPFLLMAAILYPVSKWISGSGSNVYIYRNELLIGISIFLKGIMALVILILLTSTEKFNDLLLGMRKLKMPKLAGIISALMYRYVFIIHDEMLKTSRARDSRTPGKPRLNRFRVYGNQSAMIFIRSTDRAQKIYNSMLSRGFRGEFPGMRNLSLRWEDFLYAAGFMLAILSVRLTNRILFCYF